MAALIDRLFASARGSRRGRRRWFAPAGAAVERLEDRTLPAAGTLLWNPPVDFTTTLHYFNDVAVQSDGKVVAVGIALIGGDYDFLVARYTAGGRLDLSFGANGYRYYDFGGGRNDSAAAVLIQPDGKILVGGRTVSAAGEDSGLIRLNPDGSYDTSFGTGGKVITAEAAGGGEIFALALTSDGRIVATGRHDTDTTSGGIARYLPNGTPDGSFGGGDGQVDMPVQIEGLAIDTEGRIVTGDVDGTVSRLTFEGAYDDSFNGNGRKSVGYDFGTEPAITDLAVDAGNRIVVVGYSRVGAVYQAGAARILPGGGYDDSFNFNGRITFDATPAVSPNVTALLVGVAVLPNGGIIAAGYESLANSNWFLAALTPAGSLDTGFDGDGIKLFAVTGSGSPSGLAVTKSGHYVTAGSAQVPGRDIQPAIAAFEGYFPRRDDLLGWSNAGDWYVAASLGAALENRYYATWNPAGGWKLVDVADFNGDGRADIAGRDGTGQWWIGFNTGAGFATVAATKWNEAAQWRDVRFADFNGDGRADVAARTRYGEWWVSLGTGTGLSGGALWASWSEGAGWRDVLAADFTGDGRADLAGRTSGGDWFVGKSVSTGAGGFTTTRWAGWSETAQWRDVRFGDFNGDGRQDLAGRTYYGDWHVARSTGAAFVTEYWTTWTESVGWRNVLVGDFDGDGRIDLAGRAANGEWYVARSTGTSFATTRWDAWAEGGDWRDIRVGDFDGDGKSDIAGRTYYGEWWVSKSNGSRFVKSLWGGWNEAAGWRTFRQEFAPTV